MLQISCFLRFYVHWFSSTHYTFEWYCLRTSEYHCAFMTTVYIRPPLRPHQPPIPTRWISTFYSSRHVLCSVAGWSSSYIHNTYRRYMETAHWIWRNAPHKVQLNVFHFWFLLFHVDDVDVHKLFISSVRFKNKNISNEMTSIYSISILMWWFACGNICVW